MVVSNVRGAEQALSVRGSEMSLCARAIKIGSGRDRDLGRDLENNQHMNK